MPDAKNNLLDVVIDAMVPGGGGRPLSQAQLRQIALTLIGIEQKGATPRRGRPPREELHRVMVLSFLTCRRVDPDMKIDALYFSVAAAWGTTPAFVKKIMTARELGPLRHKGTADIEQWGLEPAKATVRATLQAHRKGRSLAARGTKKRRNSVP